MIKKKKSGQKKSVRGRHGGNSATARCDIALLVDAEAGDRRSSGQFVPLRSSVEAYVFAELRRQGLQVTVIPFVAGVDETLNELRTLKPKLVFNLTECVDGDRSQDAAIAGLLDLLKIPYTGTGPAWCCCAALFRDPAQGTDPQSPSAIPADRQAAVR
jgi:hypothetical protein